jgi:hypothetical protein
MDFLTRGAVANAESPDRSYHLVLQAFAPLEVALLADDLREQVTDEATHRRSALRRLTPRAAVNLIGK